MLTLLKQKFLYITPFSANGKKFEIFRSKEKGYSYIFFENKDNKILPVNMQDYMFLNEIFYNSPYQMDFQEIDFKDNKKIEKNVFSTKRVFNSYNVKAKFKIVVKNKIQTVNYNFILNIDENDQTKNISCVCKFVNENIANILRNAVDYASYDINTFIQRNRTNSLKIYFTSPQYVEQKGCFFCGETDAVYVFPTLTKKYLTSIKDEYILNAEYYIENYKSDLDNILRHELGHYLSVNKDKEQGEIGFVDFSYHQATFSALNEYMNVRFTSCSQLYGYQEIVNIASKIHLPKNAFEYYLKSDRKSYFNDIANYYGVNSEKICYFYLKLDAYLNLYSRGLERNDLRNNLLADVCELELNKRMNNSNNFMQEFDNYNLPKDLNLFNYINDKRILILAKKNFIENLLLKKIETNNLSDVEDRLIHTNWFKDNIIKYGINVKKVIVNSNRYFLTKGHPSSFIGENALKYLRNNECTDIDDYLLTILLQKNLVQIRLIDDFFIHIKSYLQRDLKDDDYFKIISVLPFNSLINSNKFIQKLPVLNDCIYEMLINKISLNEFLNIASKVQNEKSKEDMLVKVLKSFLISGKLKNETLTSKVIKIFQKGEILNKLTIELNNEKYCEYLVELKRLFKINNENNMQNNFNNDDFSKLSLLDWSAKSFVEYLNQLKQHSMVQNAFHYVNNMFIKSIDGQRDIENNSLWYFLDTALTGDLQKNYLIVMNEILTNENVSNSLYSDGIKFLMNSSYLTNDNKLIMLNNLYSNCVSNENTKGLEKIKLNLKVKIEYLESVTNNKNKINIEELSK